MPVLCLARRDLLLPYTSRLLFSGSLLLAVLLTGCGKSNTPTGAPGAPSPVEVGVVTVTQGNVGLITELPGRLEASRVAQVRARAAGILQKRVFTEGSDVKAGQLLFRIDAAPYAAAYQSAQAALAKAQANLGQAAALAERYKPLVEANAVSQQDYANAVAGQKQAEADVAGGKAAVQTAKINLDYASVTAPISGRIGRALVTEGALVGQGEATQLAVIQQIDPLYVNFTQPAGEVMKLRKALDDGQLKRASGSAAASVRLVLEDGTEYARPGRLLFSDLTVDATTGQIMLRAEVPNPGGLLLPGLYVRVRLEQAQAGDAVLLPQQAVARSNLGDSVLVVSGDGKVTQRQVKVGNAQGAQWVILGGLKTGEQVMVDGFQKLRPNATVKAIAWHAQATSPASAPAASASAR
ncbi:MAG: efflux RND transporter periplasmic adaptor subunit [Burkholderiaceae bacterium]|nr:MAG: efflux RND transporter periplasmic adaptor subunit [Burkholderiaceae bacterium]